LRSAIRAIEICHSLMSIRDIKICHRLIAHSKWQISMAPMADLNNSNWEHWDLPLKLLRSAIHYSADPTGDVASVSTRYDVARNWVTRLCRVFEGMIAASPQNTAQSAVQNRSLIIINWVSAIEDIEICHWEHWDLPLRLLRSAIEVIEICHWGYWDLPLRLLRSAIQYLQSRTLRSAIESIKICHWGYWDLPFTVCNREH
jgi:hypothetical protein